MIREFKDADIEELLDVWYDSSSLAHPFLEEDFMEQEMVNVRDVYIPVTKTWVNLSDGILDGFISMIGNEVGAIFVSPEKHGRGIGKSLMDHVSKLHDELEVEVFKENKIGRDFYDKYGFKIIKEHLHEETGDRLLRMKFTKEKS